MMSALDKYDTSQNTSFVTLVPDTKFEKRKPPPLNLDFIKTKEIDHIDIKVDIMRPTPAIPLQNQFTLRESEVDSEWRRLVNDA